MLEVRRFSQIADNDRFAERELDVEKSFKLKTSNSRLFCLECYAVRRAVETARIENIAARLDKFKCASFSKRISVSTER